MARARRSIQTRLSAAYRRARFLTFDWPTGADLQGRDSVRVSGIPPLATLLALAITQAIVLLYVHYELGQNPYALSVYAVVGLIILGGMVGIMRAAHLQQPSGVVPAFDGPTRRWGSWGYTLTAGGLLLVFLLAANNYLPQKPSVQQIRRTNYDWNVDGTAGLKITYKIATPIDAQQPLVLVVDLSDKLAADWTIQNVVGYSDPWGKNELEREGPAKDPDRTTPTHHVSELRNLVEETYYVVVALRSPTKATRESLLRILQADKDAVRVTIAESTKL